MIVWNQILFNLWRTEIFLVKSTFIFTLKPSVYWMCILESLSLGVASILARPVLKRSVRYQMFLNIYLHINVLFNEKSNWSHKCKIKTNKGYKESSSNRTSKQEPPPPPYMPHGAYSPIYQSSILSQYYFFICFFRCYSKVFRLSSSFHFASL